MSRGHDRERDVRRQLEEDGWVVFRAAGSLGIADLVALRRTFTPQLIEVKSTADGPYKSFGPADRADLLHVAERAGAEAWLVWWPPRRPAQWIPSDRWPAAKLAHV